MSRFGEPKATIPTDPLQLAYLAGLFDGEGCLTRGHKGGLNWRIQIAMIDRPVIEWLGEIGGTTKPRVQTNPRKNIVWVWLLMRQLDVLPFLVAISPYVRVKRETVERAIGEIEQRLRTPAADYVPPPSVPARVLRS